MKLFFEEMDSDCHHTIMKEYRHTGSRIISTAAEYSYFEGDVDLDNYSLEFGQDAQHGDIQKVLTLIYNSLAELEKESPNDFPEGHVYHIKCDGGLSYKGMQALINFADSKNTHDESEGSNLELRLTSNYDSKGRWVGRTHNKAHYFGTEMEISYDELDEAHKDLPALSHALATAHANYAFERRGRFFPWSTSHEF